VIIEKQEGNPPPTIPDGLENTAAHNLITYKPHNAVLDSWAIDELTGHYVNYRKQISPSLDNLLPEDDFKLFAVSTRFPEQLAHQVKFRGDRPGVFDLTWGVRDIRLIVLSRIPKSKHNAPWLMFSAVPEKVRYGAEYYTWRSPISTVMNSLFSKYQLEGISMPYTFDDYMRDIKQEAFSHITDEDIDRILSALKPEDRLRGLKPEERLNGLNPKEIEEYLKKLKENKMTIH
jgi:hypothetical protein